jgi:MFS family permease
MDTPPKNLLQAQLNSSPPIIMKTPGPYAPEVTEEQTMNTNATSKRPLTRDDLKLVLTSLSVFLITTFTGIISAWGFIEPYFESYISQHNHGINSATIQVGACIIFMTFPVSTIIFPYLIVYVGYKQSIRTALVSYALGYLCFYKMEYIALFYIGFVFVGFGFTLIGTMCGFLMMALVPNRKGMASAIASLGSAMTPLILGYIGQYIMNPDYEKPVIRATEGLRVIM